MSGFGLIFNRKRAPVTPGLTEHLLDALTHRGGDGCDIYHGPSMSMGHQHFWTTPEEVGEQQPLTTPTGLSLVFDGRLDNRQELLGALGHDDVWGRALSDAHVILLAYERWGEDCLTRLLGPFALALYDAKRRCALCARDPLGDRTLFYHLTPQHLIIASEEQAILTHPAVSASLYTPRLAAYFALQTPADGATFYTDIYELLPAHGMTIEADKSRTWRYWDTDSSARIRYRTDTEYADHFRSLLDKSVACRLRAPSPPAVMMSGGLDSTAITAMAARQLRNHSQAVHLPTISFVFDEFQSCDERGFMAAMMAQYPLQASQLLGDDAWPLNHIDTWPLNPNSPENDAYRHLQTRVYQSAHDSARRVVLSGEGGDQLYMGAESWLGDLLRERHFRHAARDSVLHIRDQGLLPFIRSAGLHRLLGWRWIRRRWPKSTLPWLTPWARAALSQADVGAPSARTAARPQQHESVLGLLSAHSLCVESFYASQAGVEIRYPYRDRRLVEFMLSVPTQQLYNGGIYKYILRNATVGLLPEQIRNRVQPTMLYPLFLRGIVEKQASTVQCLLQEPNRIWPRYIRSDWLSSQPLGRQPPGMAEFILWLCLCCELWRKRFGTQLNL